MEQLINMTFSGYFIQKLTVQYWEQNNLFLIITFSTMHNLKYFYTFYLPILKTEVDNNTSFFFLHSLKWNQGKAYFRSQILERPSIGEYWNIFWCTSIARKSDI